MKGIMIIIFALALLTVIFFSVLYVLIETSWGDWIANLVTHPQLSNTTAKDLIHALHSHIHF
jgi:hypothetical protein